MKNAQVVAVALCTIINTMDGFDILAAAVTAPAIAGEWGLSPQELGLLLSSGLAGMTLGALGVSPIADRWGRRRTVLLSLVLVALGMFGSAAAPGPALLMTSRLVTGAGVGTMMPTINTVVAEVSSRRRRDLSVCLQGAGFPLGGALGGIGAYLILGWDWRWLFGFGGLLAVLLVPPVLFWLPESIDFLVARRPPGALMLLNRWLSRLGIEPLRELPRKHDESETFVGIRRALAGQLGISSLLICSSFFLLMFTFYFLTNWTPKLLTDYGLSERTGISGAILMNLGGVTGDLLFTFLMLRWPASRMGPVFMSLCFATVLLFSVMPMTLTNLVPVSLLLGFLLFGSMLSLYAIVPTLYPASLRTTGTGLALGVGRIGAVIGPYTGGALVAAGLSRCQYLLLMAVPLPICALLAAYLSAHLARSAQSMQSADSMLAR